MLLGGITCMEMCLRAQEVSSLKLMQKGLKMKDIVDLMQPDGENLCVGTVRKVGTEKLNLVMGTTQKNLGVIRSDTTGRKSKKKKHYMGSK